MNMDKYQITLNKVRRVKEDSVFSDTYQKLLSGGILNVDEVFYLLKAALLFINSGDTHIEKLGYRIILRYSNVYG